VKKPLLVNLTLCLWFCFASSLHAVEPSDSTQVQKPSFEQMLTDALKCIKMTPGDLKLRDDYVDFDSFRLELIDRLMRNPMETMSFNNDFLSDWLSREPEFRRYRLPAICADYLRRRGERPLLKSGDTRVGAPPPDADRIRDLNLKPRRSDPRWNKILEELPEPLRRAVKYLCGCLRASNTSVAEACQRLSEQERIALRHNFPVILLEDVEDEFKTPEELDALGDYEELLAKDMIPSLSKIKVREIISAGDNLSSNSQTVVLWLREYLASRPRIEPLVYNNQDRANDLILKLQTPCGEVVIGGYGSSKYGGSPAMIIDLGGDDEYDISIDSTADFASSVIIDLRGDDLYRADGDFCYGSGFFGNGILVDLAGDDTYLTRNFSLGSGLFGVGILIDEGGNDRYFGDTFCQGAGSFGMGFLVDMKGSDQYSAALYAQGFGFVSGLGALIDSSGNDNYFAGGRYKDILRYEDHYISLSQGFAYGLRPMMSGGIGVLFDLAGSDLYTSDIFGQGSSYWFSLGTLMDSEGNDNYVSFQYAQGAATHLTLGILEDSAGDDVYISHGVSQGCGHDLAFGILWDKEGNDKYVAESLSQGAGSANGFGILVDEAGNDGYFVDVKSNTQGYGNPRRDYGSVGMLLDFSGRDSYRGNGADSSWWTTPSKWGVGVDK
jgi:hypothetical protein